MAETPIVPVPFSGFTRMVLVVSMVLAAVALGSASAAAQEKVAANSLEKFSGVYELSGKRLLYIQPWPGGGGKLAYSEQEGPLRALFPVSENVFSAGPGLLLPTPVEVTITFLRNSQGKVTRLIWQQEGQADRAAGKLESYKWEEVRFRTGPLRLAGTLLLPPGKGSHPALVLLQGTGAADRYAVLPIVHFLLSHGMALLSYDQRGVGGSPGDWRTVSLEERAGDALAAVQFLKSRKDIDPKRIGVFGASQGGWVAPLAASQSADIAFVICVSGPGESPAKVEEHRLEHDLRRRNFPENAISNALALMALRDRVARGEASKESLLEAAEKAAPEGWLRYAPVPPSADSWLFEHWRRLPLDYDPAPLLEKLRVPVLAFFGGLDQTVLPNRNAAKWRAALQRGGVKDYTVRIFPNGNHMLLEARTGAEDEFPRLQGFVPEYAPLLLDWLRRRAILARSAKRE